VIPKGITYGDKLGDLVFEGYFKNISINKSGIIKKHKPTIEKVL